MELGELIIQIMFISLVMVVFGMFLNRIMGLKPSKMKELRDKALNLQERMSTAQAIGDAQLLSQIQRETMQLTKQMMVKQFIPTCIRCVIFLVIFAILGIIYADFPEWFLLYFLFSLGFSLLFFGLRHLYKKATGKEDNKTNLMREISGLSTGAGLESIVQVPKSFSSELTPSNQSYQQTNDGVNGKETPEKADSWKDRIEK